MINTMPSAKSLFLLIAFFAICLSFSTNSFAQDNPFKSFIGSLSNSNPSTLKYKQYSCKTLDQAMVCAPACEYVNDVDFRVSVENNFVIKKIKNHDYISFKNLGLCAVWDVNNWQCEETDTNPIRYVFYMINGNYYQYLRGQKPDAFYCAR
jgi:hypothetical protein